MKLFSPVQLSPISKVNDNTTYLVTQMEVQPLPTSSLLPTTKSCLQYFLNKFKLIFSIHLYLISDPLFAIDKEVTKLVSGGTSC